MASVTNGSGLLAARFYLGIPEAAVGRYIEGAL